MRALLGSLIPHLLPADHRDARWLFVLYVTRGIGDVLLASVGMRLVTVAILLMAQLHATSAAPVAVLVLVVYGAGAGVFHAPSNTEVMSASPPTARGTVSGFLALSRSLGKIAGVALVAAMLALLRGTEPAARCGTGGGLIGGSADGAIMPPPLLRDSGLS